MLDTAQQTEPALHAARPASPHAEGAPRVTVLLAIHNGERYLVEALSSILQQDYTDFDLLVIDDGSTDATAQILAGQSDPRLNVVRNETNLGLAASLNRGLDLARGEYVARMDADDVAERHRLRTQVAFLDSHPDVGIVGTNATFIDAAGNELGPAIHPPDDLAIRWAMRITVPFTHPTVLLRRRVLDEHALRYDPAYRTAQDFDLWFRLLRHTRGANLGEPLLRYRMHPQSVGVAQRAGQQQTVESIILKHAPASFGGEALSPEDLAGIRALLVFHQSADRTAALLSRYLDMFDTFASEYAREPSLPRLRRKVALQVAGVAGAGLRRPGIASLWPRLLALEPLLPLLCVPGFVRLAARKLRLGQGR